MSGKKVHLEEAHLREIIRVSLVNQRKLSEGANDQLSTVLAGAAGPYLGIARLIGYFMAGSSYEPSYGIQNFWVPLLRNTTLAILAKSLSAGDIRFAEEQDPNYGLGSGTYSESDPSSTVAPALNFILLNLLSGRPVSYTRTGSQPVKISPGATLGAIADSSVKKIWYSGSPSTYSQMAQDLGYTLVPVNDDSSRRDFIDHINQNPNFLDQLLKPPAPASGEAPSEPGGLTYDVASKSLTYYDDGLQKEIAVKLNTAEDRIMQDATLMLETFNSVEVKETILHPLAFPGSWLAYDGLESSDSMFTTPWRQTWGMMNMINKKVMQSGVQPVTALVALAINLNNYIVEGAPSFSGIKFDTSAALNEARRKVMLTHEQLTRVIQAALALKMNPNTSNVILESPFTDKLADLLGYAPKVAGEVPNPNPFVKAAQDLNTSARGVEALSAKAAAEASRLKELRTLADLDLGDARKALDEIIKLLDRSGSAANSTRLDAALSKAAADLAAAKKVAISADELAAAGVGAGANPVQKAAIQKYLDAACAYVNDITDPSSPSSPSLNAVTAARNELNRVAGSVLPAVVSRTNELVAAQLAKSARDIPQVDLNKVSRLTAMAIAESFGLKAPTNLIIIATEGGGFKFKQGTVEVSLDEIQRSISDATNTNDSVLARQGRDKLISYGFKPIANYGGTEAAVAEKFVTLIPNAGSNLSRSILTATEKELLTTRLTFVFDTLTREVTAGALAQSVANPISSSGWLKAGSKIKKILTVDGRADSITGNFKKYKESKAELLASNANASTAGLTKMFLASEFALLPASGQRIQTSLGRLVFRGIGAAAEGMGAPGVAAAMRAAGGVEAYWRPRLVGWVITTGVWGLLYDAESNPENEFTNALYTAMTTGSTLKPAGLGTVFLRATAGALASASRLVSDLLEPNDAVTKYIALVSKPSAALTYLSDAIKAYSTLLTGTLTETQLTTMFPGLVGVGGGLGISAIPDSLEIIQQTTGGPIKLGQAFYKYVTETKAKKEAAEQLGQSADNSAEEAELSDATKAIAAEAARDRVRLAALSKMIDTKTMAYAGPAKARLKGLNGRVITLSKQLSDDIAKMRDAIYSKSAITLSINSSLSESKEMMISNYRRSYDDAQAPEAVRSAGLSADKFIERYCGENNILTLAIHASMKSYTNFSDDPTSLATLGMGFVKVHGDEFGYDVLGDEFSPETLIAIGKATDAAVKNFNDAYQAALVTQPQSQPQ